MAPYCASGMARIGSVRLVTWQDNQQWQCSLLLWCSACDFVGMEGTRDIWLPNKYTNEVSKLQLMLGLVRLDWLPEYSMLPNDAYFTIDGSKQFSMVASRPKSYFHALDQAQEMLVRFPVGEDALPCIRHAFSDKYCKIFFSFKGRAS